MPTTNPIQFVVAMLECRVSGQTVDELARSSFPGASATGEEVRRVRVPLYEMGASVRACSSIARSLLGKVKVPFFKLSGGLMWNRLSGWSFLQHRNSPRNLVHPVHVNDDIDSRHEDLSRNENDD